ncbi:MAG: TRAP transporter substrate-binding protein [Rhodospirillaceae bacterium]|nr:TRAP transporter substrate-binding protein [Rhodospirillaceae bacterium]
MMLTRRTLFGAGAALAAAPSALAASDKIRLRLSTYLAPVSHSLVNIITPWMKALDRDSAGRLGFDLYTGGALGRSPYAQFDLIRSGVADLGFAQPSYTTGQFKQLQILEVPFLTQNATEASLVAWELCQRGLVQGFEGVKLLGLWTAEPGQLFTRVPFKTFADIKNLKIRSSGRLEGEFIQSLGASAEAMFPADVYEAMRRETIDGTVQGLVAAQTFQTYRVSTHVSTAPFGVVLFLMIMNRKTWDKLPADIQDIITLNSGQRMALLGGTAYDKRVKEIDAKYRANPALTYVEATPEDLEQLRAATKPLVEAWIARTANGAAVHEAALDILKQLRQRERMS